MATTTSSLFLKTLRDADIQLAFVNWGSDHPALIQDIQRQRAENQDGQPSPRIITCPNEMVALSAAHGYAQLTGTPAAVLVHVDVGTQALAGAIHNADRGRVPVLIYAGAAPVTLQGEAKGSRNEYIFWLQDIPDQPAILRQYMRFTSQISSAHNVDHVVLRALQIAKTEPKGPVYLWGRREVMEEDIPQSSYNKPIQVHKWKPAEAVCIPQSAAKMLASKLAHAQNPLIVTSYLGRDPSSVPLLVHLSSLLAIPVHVSCPSVLSFPHTHPNFAGVSYGNSSYPALEKADVVLVLDADVPWIPMKAKPREGAEVYHVDCDVSKSGIGMFHIDVDASWCASTQLSLQAILDEVTNLSLPNDIIRERKDDLAAQHASSTSELRHLETLFPKDNTFGIINLISTLRSSVPPHTTFLNESISNFPRVWAHLIPERPGSIYTSGASSLGWGLGAAIGAKLALGGAEFLCLIVGDGSFMFGVPSSAYWIARKYDTPFLTVILNNGGWRAPKMSMLGIYPQAAATAEDLGISFGPQEPDYAGIAAAAGGAWGRRISLASELKQTIKEGIRVVLEEKRCAVLDCLIEPIDS